MSLLWPTLLGICRILLLKFSGIGVSLASYAWNFLSRRELVFIFASFKVENFDDSAESFNFLFLLSTIVGDGVGDSDLFLVSSRLVSTLSLLPLSLLVRIDSLPAPISDLSPSLSMNSVFRSSSSSLASVASAITSAAICTLVFFLVKLPDLLKPSELLLSYLLLLLLPYLLPDLVLVLFDLGGIEFSLLRLDPDELG